LAKQLRIGGVPEHFNLPWKLAAADRAFGSISVDVEFVEYPGGTGAMTTALRADKLDAALMLTEGAALDIVTGGDNRLVSVYVESPLVWGIHVSASGAIRSVADIAGQRFAISRYGSGSHLIAIVDAAERGFDSQSMSFVVVDTIDGARAALAAGAADVFLWERHMTQPLVDAGEFRRIGERVVPWPAFVVSARREYLSHSADALRHCLDIVADYAARLKHGADSAELVSKTYAIDPADASAWLAGVRWSQDHEYPSDDIHRVLTALRSQGVIPDAEVGENALWQSLVL
jgi:ABC-type nitrate/sulfonate/bicarbonate transport system substrate-binding protein